ncbi:MAG: 30S ribosomal protein S21 [Candidatus Gracilibacteria bacterium]|jgi:ribosomal protein S21|nr:30S ribosomal protein S21 [Candidatus Gracilibacteria bacterium]
MAVWAVRKGSETNEKLIKRFKKQTQRARVIYKVRNNRYHEGVKTKRRVRDEAISREEYRAVREKEKFYV